LQVQIFFLSLHPLKKSGTGFREEIQRKFCKDFDKKVAEFGKFLNFVVPFVSIVL